MRKILYAAVVLLAASIAAPSHVHATGYYSGVDQNVTRFIQLMRWLQAGVPVTYSTANLSGAADPVLHVFFNGVQVAADDDSGGGRNSRVTFTPATTGDYIIVVRAYHTVTGGTANLVENSSTMLTNAVFGGRRDTLTWKAGDTFRVTGISRERSNDMFIMLLQSSLNALQYDDDGGPRGYSELKALQDSTSTSAVMWGRTIGATGGPGYLTIDDGINDVDRDGIGAALETAAGLRNDAIDTDGDSIPDNLELFGNDGAWSYAETVGPTDRHNGVRGNVYVEIDCMVSADDNHCPYGALGTDIRAIFAADSSSLVRVETVVSTIIPRTRYTTFDSCPAGAIDCVNFYTLKSQYFSPGLPEIRNYWHYAIFTAQQQPRMGGNPCSSGVAEVWGNDLIVSLDPRGCSFVLTNEISRGTFMHELGHNLNLTHMGNDAPTRAYSTVHNSVMNYRYQFPGITGRSGVLAHSYSVGANACAPCATSPKQACIDSRNAGNCASTPSCDCDVNEWNGSTMRLDMGRSPNFSDGDDVPSSENPRYAEMRGRGGKDLTTLPVAEVVGWDITVEQRRRNTERARQLQNLLGRTEGRDFIVSADKTTLYSVCQ